MCSLFSPLDGREVAQPSLGTHDDCGVQSLAHSRGLIPSYPLLDI